LQLGITALLLYDNFLLSDVWRAAMITNSEDLRETSYKIWRAREAEKRERRRQEGKVAIWLERGPNYAETFMKEAGGPLFTVSWTVPRSSWR